MAKKIKDLDEMSAKEIKEAFVTLLNSCAEGYTGEWDPTGEGKDGFVAMHGLLVDLADHYKVDISKAKGRI